MKTLTMEEQAEVMLNAERDSAQIPYGDMAHWWKRKAIALQVKLWNAPQKCGNCGRFHPDYTGDYCPARDDGGY